MIRNYNRLRGVPRFCYYLERITQFADFEVQEESQILYTSRRKSELINLCKLYNWPCCEAGTAKPNEWGEYLICYRGLF